MAHNIWNDEKQNAMWCKGDRKAAWHDAQTWEQAMGAENAFVGTGDKLKQDALETILLDTAGNPIHSAIYSRPASSGSLLDQVLANHS